MSNQIMWDGEADTANKTFGESYGIDWEYLPNSQDIKVKDQIIKVGDIITLL